MAKIEGMDEQIEKRRVAAFMIEEFRLGDGQFALRQIFHLRAYCVSDFGFKILAAFHSVFW